MNLNNSLSYNELLKGQFKYGTTKEDIIKKDDFDRVLENVVIAPWWGVEMFENFDYEVTKINDKLYNLKNKKVEFSFIQLKLIGAPVIMDCVLRLGVSKCKKILFIGSVGSLVENIKIGDIVVPKYSICGDGASRYFNRNLEDEFGKISKPCQKITNKLLKIIKEICDEEKLNFHHSINFSIDTIFAQFAHIDKIKEMKSEVIEMETYNLFKAARVCGIKATALFCVSDNTVIKKSLFSGRTEEENSYRHNVRKKVIPKIVGKFFEE